MGHNVTLQVPQHLPVRGKRFVRRLYKLRVVGLGAGSLCVVSTLWFLPHVSPAIWALVVLHGFIWPHLACYLGLRNRYPYQFERFCIMVDSCLGGFWTIAMHFNVLSCTVMLAMMSMDNIAAGGSRLFLRGLASQLLGALIGIAMLGLQFQFQPRMETILACLPFMALYPLALGSTTYRLAKQLSTRSAELERLSRIDGLTGLFNRPYWETCLVETFADCRAKGQSSCLALLDLDHFKSVNDSYRHASGDLALQVFAQLLRKELRATDIIGRYGGEEFVVILVDTPLADAVLVIERLTGAIRRMASQLDSMCPCTASIGLVGYRPELESYQMWLKEVDQAMYRAKTGGRDRIEVDALRAA